jgi:hypothetical protein
MRNFYRQSEEPERWGHSLQALSSRDKPLSLEDIINRYTFGNMLRSSQAATLNYPLRLGLCVSILVTLTISIAASVLLTVGLTSLGVLLFGPVLTGFYITLWLTRLLGDAGNQSCQS